ncbi:MAG: hypothetical protein ACOZNI_07025 [Myxococcota bacterium]
MILAQLFACGGGEPVETLVLTGWRYEWQELSHRVAYVRVGLEDDSSLRLGLVGGDWSTGEQFSDAPDYAVRYARVRTPFARAVRGEVTFEVGPDGTAEAEAVVDAGELGDGELVALLDGFEIDTDVAQGDDYPADYDPAHGYASQGFAFAAGTPVREGDAVRVPVVATVRWGPQDRPDMNEAVPFATTGVSVRVLVVAHDGELATREVAVERQQPWDPPMTEQEPLLADVAFDSPRPEGFVGWTALDLQANFDGPDAGEGEYLRAFGAELAPTADEKGAWEGEVAATLSNTSLSEFTQLHAGFTGTLAYVGVKDAEVEHFLVEGTHPVGSAKTGPTLAD